MHTYIVLLKDGTKLIVEATDIINAKYVASKQEGTSLEDIDVVY